MRGIVLTLDVQPGIAVLVAAAAGTVADAPFSVYRRIRVLRPVVEGVVVCAELGKCRFGVRDVVVDYRGS